MTDQRTTELDDAIEQVLDQYIPDTLWRIEARNRVCSLIAAAGFDVFAQVPEPDDMRPASAGGPCSSAAGEVPMTAPSAAEWTATAQQLIDAGYTKESVAAAVETRNVRLLVHRGRYATRLMPPSTGETGRSQ